MHAKDFLKMIVIVKTKDHNSNEVINYSLVNDNNTET